MSPSLLHTLNSSCIAWSRQQEAGIGRHVNADKTEHMCFNLERTISTLNGGYQKFVDKFTYLSSSVSSIESDVNIRLAKA